ncbi:hypothetical protein BJ170DRAFT_166136 [Xylariales sp. AK1849]|nr:hypothetical protein BJ170DRAFT_166136 [Xylariales sp. AK1849]
MTKAWEVYEADIKALYQLHKLEIVRQIMDERYGFKASIRAYRQKLDAWGCGKYKKREKHAGRDSQSEDNRVGTSNAGPSSTPAPRQGPEGPWQNTPRGNTLPTYSMGTSWPLHSVPYGTTDTSAFAPPTVSCSQGQTPLVPSQNIQYPDPHPESYWSGSYHPMHHTTSNVHQNSIYATGPMISSFPAYSGDESSPYNDEYNGPWNNNNDPDDDSEDPGDDSRDP